MINVTIYKDSSKQYKGFMVKGHAGYDKFGKDIVCAAVSVLAVNTVNSIEKLSTDDINLDSNDDGGFICLKFTNTVSLESRVLMDSLVLGLEGIQEENKKYISIIFKEV